MNVSDVNQGVNMVFWWRVRLYLSLLRSVDCLNLQRVFGVRWEAAAAPGEVCSVGCKCAGMWPLFLGCLAYFALVVVAGKKTGAHGRDRCRWYRSKLESCGLSEQEKSVLCIEVCWDGEKTCLWAGFLCFAFAYTNMQNDFYEMPNSPFVDSKIWSF